MNKFFSELIDYYALNKLHRKKSIESQFCEIVSSPCSIDELNVFYPSVQIPSIEFTTEMQQNNYNIGKYKFISQINGELCNKYSIGKFYKTNTNSVNIVLVHGWRMDSTEKLENIFQNNFLNKGYNIYYFTLPFHLDRTPNESLYSGEYLISANVERMLISIKQAVTDLRALLLWLKNKGNKTILIGVSLGGFITNLTSILEDKFDALISVFYANDIAFTIWNTIPGKHIKEDLKNNSFTYEKLKEYLKIINPSNFKSILPKERILLLSGVYDKYVLNEDSEKLWNAWENPRRIVYSCGHAGIVLYKNRIAKDTNSFIKDILVQDV